jgi:hypothetical protein
VRNVSTACSFACEVTVGATETRLEVGVGLGGGALVVGALVAGCAEVLGAAVVGWRVWSATGVCGFVPPSAAQAPTPPPASTTTATPTISSTRPRFRLGGSWYTRSGPRWDGGGEAGGGTGSWNGGGAGSWNGGGGVNTGNGSATVGGAKRAGSLTAVAGSLLASAGNTVPHDVQNCPAPLLGRPHLVQKLIFPPLLHTVGLAHPVCVGLIGSVLRGRDLGWPGIVS